MELSSGSKNRCRVGVRKAVVKKAGVKKAVVKKARRKHRKKTAGPTPNPACRTRLVKDGKCRILSQSVVVRGGCLHEGYKRHGLYGGHKVNLPLLEVAGRHFLVVLMRNYAWCRLLTGRRVNEGPLSSQLLWATWREKLAEATLKGGTGSFATIYLPESFGFAKQRTILCVRDSRQLTLECTAGTLNWLLQNIVECPAVPPPPR
jgi:hypothetical protein